MPFPARYPGLCIPCGDSIKQGDSITNHPVAGYVHEECVHDVGNAPEMDAETREATTSARSTMPRGKRASDRCGVCFQVPASNGVCGCQ